MRIAIEGNIGSGKSTLAVALSAALDRPLRLEPVASWSEGLDLFYGDANRWAATFNTQVLLSYDPASIAHDAVMERSAQSCRYVFTQLHADTGVMTPYELRIFDALYSRVAWRPDVVFYLRADPGTCIQRIAQRGRRCETSIPDAYIHQLHDAYERFMSDQPDAIVIDGRADPATVLAETLRRLPFSIRTAVPEQGTTPP
jgi:deoxyadenosine/deoxycytidine kinase